MKSTPPRTLRTLRLLSKLAFVRAINRMGALFFRKKPKPGQKRTATPPKRRRHLFFAALIFLMWAFMVGNLSGQMLGRFAGVLDNPPLQENGRIVVDWLTYGEIELTRRELDRLEEDPTVPTKGGFVDVESEKASWRQSLRSSFARDARLDGMSDEDAEVHADRMMQLFSEEGPDGFAPVRRQRYDLPFHVTWPSEANRPAMVGVVGSVTALVFLMLVFTAFGGRDTDIGKVEYSLEWLFTFPVSTRVLFVGKLLGYALMNLFGWMVLVPFLGVTLWSGGWGVWSLVVAPVAAAYMLIIIAAVRVLGETWMRKTFRPNRLRNLQAVCSVVWIAFFGALMFVAYMRDVPAWMRDAIARLDASAAWNPASLPAALCLHEGAPLAAGLMVLLAFLVPAAAVVLCARMVRGGLVTQGGSYAGTRTRPTRDTGGGPFRGIVGKDVKLLLRDRSLLVQTFILPLAVVGMQFMVNPGLLKAAAKGQSHLAVIAFAVGAYVMIFGAFRVLLAEGQALWLLYTFPHRIEDVMRRKVLLWASLAMVYTVAILAAGFARSPDPLAQLPNAVMAVAGVFIYAYIAAGLGILGTNPLQTEKQHMLRPEYSMLYMLLASMFAHAFYAPSAWTKIAQVTLTALVAYAIWQKVRDHAPFLLDPTQMPPPRVALGDGLVAALAFFTVQGVVFLFTMVAEPGAVSLGIVLGYVIAGVTVSAVMMFLFWRRKVPNLAETVGLRRASTDAPGKWKNVAIGVLLGGAAGALGLGWIALADVVGPLSELKQQSVTMSAENPMGLGWTVFLVVIAAPIFEEFLFRGLVFRGLRRSLPLGLSLLASAGIFAVVHPPFSVVPVFFLGLAAAYAFERTRLLLAPIAAHMTYNLIVVLFGAAL